MFNLRLKQLQKRVVNPILIKKKANLFYLTGRHFDYRSDEYLLVTKKNVIGFGSGLEQIDWIKKYDRLKNIGQYLKGNKLDIEYGFTFGEGKYLSAKVKGLRAKPVKSLVDEMRQVKDVVELSNVRKSMQIVEKVFTLVKSQIRKKLWTERGLAEFIIKMGYKFGAEDIAFPAIVASGVNAAIPHHVPTSKFLKSGESIIIDFGFKYKNYCSDFTRTIFLKSVPKKLEVAYNQVEKAYNQSIKFISNFAEDDPLQSRGSSSKVIAGRVYDYAVKILKEANLDKYFIHSLGHGTGLEIHELPNLSPNSRDRLENGMIFSIEPGVYIPKLGGIRIEDLVYLSRSESPSDFAIRGLENVKVKKFINVSTKLKDNIL